MDTRKLIVLAGGLITTCLLLLLAFLSLRTLPRRPARPPVPGPPSVAELSREELLVLREAAHNAIGHLENEQLPQAQAGFTEMAERLPDEPLVRRNLAVAAYLGFEQDKVARADAMAAIEQLRRVEPDHPASFWLEARVALKSAGETPDLNAAQAERARAVSALQEAIRRAPESVVYRYELFEAVANTESPELKQAGRQALAEAYRLAPDNLFVLSEWILDLASRQDPQLVPVLESAKETIAPMRQRIQNVARADIFELTDRAIAAAREGNWSQVLLNARIVFVNLVRPQDFAQSDKRRLLPHALEFVHQQFGETLEARLAEIQSETIESQLSFVEDQTGGLELPSAVSDVVLVDFDLDGNIDIVAVTEREVVVLRREGDAWQIGVRAEVAAGSRGLLIADLDHDRSHATGDAQSPGCFDADVDVVVYGDQGITVFRNQSETDGSERRLEVVPQSRLPGYAGVVTAVLVDFDHDSDLDLVLSAADGIRPLLNEGQMQFFDASTYSQLPPPAAGITGMSIVDWDRDVDIDIVATAPDDGLVGYLENLRHGNFRWVPLETGFESLRSVRDVTALESDGNVSWDLCGTGDGGTHLVQTRTVPAESVTAERARQLGPSAHANLLAADLDNNGAQDIVAWGEQPLNIYRGLLDGAFEASEASAFEPDPPLATACDVGDLDADGDLDLVVVSEGKIRIYRNEGAGGNWLLVRALGQVDNKGKANHNAIGSLLEVKTGNHYQAQVVRRPTTHFGLGGAEQADVLRFVWTNGVPQARVQPDSNQAICELMVLKGSCPYLYAWNGERYEFVTDLLWSSPIGLQIAEHQLAPGRPWEYVLVAGDQLRQRDGVYPLVITEELWEAAYFDQVQLLAIDHPPDAAVYSNEKVGPAEIAEFTVHTAQSPLVPRAARDPRGNDVLPLIRDRDEKYFRGFTRNIVPGLVDEHFLELDLGPLDDPRQIRLFLTGWIYPTDTSLNISISQDPRQTAPQPPSLWVPDEEGTWQCMMPYMGFPGGKTKTIVVDLSDSFLTEDYRLRIVTSNEIYWDQVFYTVDEDPVPVLVQPMTLRSAELRFRGVSEPYPDRPHAPETYDFQRVQPITKWPPMGGRFTRYGKVGELLQATDDLQVILGSGDAIWLTFAAPEDPLPDGWTRDFFLFSVGWDKDADLNTIYGQTVEPLPFTQMKGYPYVEQAFPDTPRHRAYLEEYQTREAGQAAFWKWTARQ